MKTEKRCSICKKWKPIGDFNNMKASKDGKAYWCKICSRERQRKDRKKNLKQAREKDKAWRLKNPDKVRRYNLNSREKNKENLLQYMRRWRNNNRDKMRYYQKKYREKRKGSRNAK